MRIREVAVVGNCSFTALRYISQVIPSTVIHTVRRQISWRQFISSWCRLLDILEKFCMNFIEKIIEIKRESTQNYPQSMFHIKKKKTTLNVPTYCFEKNTLRGFEPDASRCSIM